MDGLLFSDGTVVAEWCSPMDSFVYYKSMKDYKAVHVDPNPDTNKVYFQDFNIKED